MKTHDCFHCGKPLSEIEHHGYEYDCNENGNHNDPPECDECCQEIFEQQTDENDEPICMGCGTRCGSNGKCVE